MVCMCMERAYGYLHVYRSYNVAFKLKAFAAAEGGSKQAAARQFQDKRKASKRVVFSSQYQLLADTGCSNCLIDMVTLDNAGERAGC